MWLNKVKTVDFWEPSGALPRALSACRSTPAARARPGTKTSGCRVARQVTCGPGKGDRPHFCAAPSGPFRQMVPVPFSKASDMRAKFLYFDLGKVLVDFSVERMLEQMAAVAGISARAGAGGGVRPAPAWERETGRSSIRRFWPEALCRGHGDPARPGTVDGRRGRNLGPNRRPCCRCVSPWPGRLSAGYPLEHLPDSLGLLSRHYRLLHDLFPVHALSFRIGAAKPEAAIFQAAAELAGCRAEEIFFVNDLPGHVTAVRAAGFDAVQFVGPEPLADALRRRGIRFNY